MERRKIIEIVIVGLLFAGCTKSKQEDWLHPTTYQESVLALLDSVATPEQLAFKKKLHDFVLAPGNTKLDGHRMIVVATDEDFNKNGIDVCYREYLQESLDETNNGIEEMLKDSIIKEEDIPRMFQEAQNEVGKK